MRKQASNQIFEELKRNDKYVINPVLVKLHFFGNLYRMVSHGAGQVNLFNIASKMVRKSNIKSKQLTWKIIQAIIDHDEELQKLLTHRETKKRRRHSEMVCSLSLTEMDSSSILKQPLTLTDISPS